MSRSRTLSRRATPPTAVVLLVVSALIAGGLEIRPAPAAGCSIATDDHAPDPLPREESPDESPEDGESEAQKHAALGSALTLDGPDLRWCKLRDRSPRRTASARLDTAPIRGPPASA